MVLAGSVMSQIAGRDWQCEHDLDSTGAAARGQKRYLFSTYEASGMTGPFIRLKDEIVRVATKARVSAAT
jgi:hypothetical protein